MEELLATDERSCSNNQNSTLDTLLEQGQWFARTGRLDQSFRAFSNAFRVGVVPEERISSLVDACLEFQRTKLCREKKEESSNSEDSSKCGSSLTCSICSCVFLKPVTIACGHTFCEVCLSEEKSFTGFIECSKCGKVVTEDAVLSVNVLIMNAIQKWLPFEYQKQERKLQGHSYLIGNDVKSAIDCFTEILTTSANDLHCLSWRSDAFLRLGQLELALRDIEEACKLHPNLARTFYRKAVILANLAKLEGILSTKHEQSVLAVLRCYSLAPKCERYRQEFTKSLHQLLSPKFSNLNRTLSVLKQGRSGGNELAPEPILEPFTLQGYLQSSLNEETHSVTNNGEGGTFASRLKSRMFGGGGRKRNKTKNRTLTFANSNETSSAKEQSQSRGNTGVLKNDPHQGKFLEGSVTREILQIREVEDFECKLCYNLLFQPVTTICGHTFCRECLERCLDHRAECPCCRKLLDQYHKGVLTMEVTQELEAIIIKYFPGDYNERMKKFNEKMDALKSSLGGDQNLQVPIFVCTLAFPKVQCPLHIFEPRYRLMLRRCLESGSRQFGMCVGCEDPEKSFEDYGVMLNVQTVNFLPDGRSIVHTVGGRRFRVISRGMMDGYHTATVEWVQDERVDDVEELKQIIELNRVGHITLQTWFSQMTAEQCQCITNAIGPVPGFDENLQLLSDGPDWVWWVLAALPLQDKPKLIILGMTSLLERIQSVIRFLQLMLSLQNKSANTSSSS